MLNKIKSSGTRPLLVCLAMVMVLACTPEPKVVGTYIADPNDSPRQSETTLELKDNGVGLWKVGDEEVSFTWHIKGEQLRVHTKGGGVLVGVLDKNTISISLPGSKEMSFRLK